MAMKCNIDIDQGSDFEAVFDIKDDNNQYVDLTGYTGAAQMRKYYTSNTAYNFQVSIDTVGIVTLSMNSANTVTISAGRYVYDCEVTSSSNVTSRILEGIVTVTPGVTR